MNRAYLVGIVGMLFGLVVLGVIAVNQAYEMNRAKEENTKYPLTSSVVTVVIPEGAGDPTSLRPFEPQTITVVIGVNNTVRWINNDLVSHWIEADNYYDPDFRAAAPQPRLGNLSNILQQGELFEYTFTKPGEIGYHGRPWERGSVKVLPNEAITNTSVNINCPTLQQARNRADFNFKSPTWMPEDYEFKCSNGAGYEMQLIYGPRYWNVTGFDEQELLAKRAIFIYMIDEEKILGEEFAAKNTTQEIELMYEQAREHNTAFLEKINGRLAFIKEKAGTPAIISFYDGSVRYSISAYLPSDILVKVVESMK